MEQETQPIKRNDAYNMISFVSANPYDRLIAEAKQSKNYSDFLVGEAFRRGEQDSMLSILEQTKDITLSDRFYNDLYEDYEVKSLELFAAVADDKEKKPHEEDIWDEYNGDWKTVTNMYTDKEWYSKVLLQSYERLDYEIDIAVTKARKDAMNGWEKFWSGVAETTMEFSEGIISAVAGLVDTVFITLNPMTWIAIGAKSATEGTDFFENYADVYSNHSLTSVEKKYVRASLDEHERKYGVFKDEYGNTTGAGQWVGGLANSMGMMIPSIAIAAATGGTSLAGTAFAKSIGTATFYASIYSSNMYENAIMPKGQRGPAALLPLNAALKTGAEVAIELALDKVLVGMGGRLLGRTGETTAKSLGKAATLAYIGKSAIREGFEEFFQDGATGLIDEFFGLFWEGYHDEEFSLQTLVDSFFAGALMSVVMGAGRVAIESGKSTIGQFVKNPNYNEKAEKYTINKDGKKVKNKAAQKYVWQRGANDITYEVDGKRKKVRGFQRLLWADYLSDFNSTMSDLKEGKLKGKKLESALQKGYDMLNVIGQYFGEIGKERSKNALYLLNRLAQKQITQERRFTDIDAAAQADIEVGYREVTTPSGEIVRVALNPTERLQMAERQKTQRKLDEQQKWNTTYDKAIAEGKTDIEAIEIADKVVPESKKPITVKSYAETLMNDVHEMVSGLAFAKVEVIKKVLEEYKEELNEAEVTELTSATDKKGETSTRKSYKKEMSETDKKIVAEAEEKAKKVVADKSASLAHRNGYEWVFGTDGKVAVEAGNILFVPSAWLENYTESEIYKFLEEKKIVTTLSESKELQNMWEVLEKFVKEKWPDLNLNREQLVLQFLFNEGLYQSFLLSNNAVNFKDFIFRLESLVELLSQDTEANTEKKALRQKLINQMKETMRKPIIKAILNWNFDPQKIGADSILTQADKEFIRAEQVHKKAVAASVKNKVVAERIDNINKYKTQQMKKALAYRDKVLNDKNATYEDYLQSYIMLRLIETNRTSDILLNLPINAFGLDFSNADTQFVADTINEVNNDYGYDFQLLALSDIYPDVLILTLEQQERLNKEKEELGINTNFQFVQKILESKLGDDFVVTSAYNLDSGAKHELNNIIREFDNINRNIGNNISVDKNKITSIIAILQKYGIDTTYLSNLLQNTDIYTPGWSTVITDIEKQINSKRNGYLITKSILSTDIKNITRTDILNFIQVNGKPIVRKLGDLFSTDIKKKYGLQFLDNYYIGINNKDNTYTNSKGIVLSPYFTVHDFYHELNHVIQDYYNLTQGTEATIKGKNGALFKKLRKLYPDAVEFIFISERFSMGENFAEEKALSKLLYLLVEGEILADRTIKDKRQHSVRLLEINGKEYVELSDGSRYQTFYLNKKQQILPDTNDETYKVNTFVQQMVEILVNRDIGASSTYHTKLTRRSAYEITSAITNPDLSVFDRVTVTINDIVTNPRQYLAPEILEELGDEFTEGQVYAFLKDWLTDNFEGINIDRDANTHNYILVDDNAFDDLYTSKTKKNNNDGTNLIEEYKGKPVVLTEFYSKEQLNRLGLPIDCVVYISENGKDELIFDEKHHNGLISLSTKHETNGDLLDALNHEFRHLMQYYNNFETGFTPDFKITEEMLADVKKRVPELFTDPIIRKLLKTDEKIVQYFFYYTNGGELEAYGIANKIQEKPSYVDIEAGNPTIFAPWYNAETGEGRYETEFLASRKSDEDFTKNGDIVVRDKEGNIIEVRKAERKNKKTKTTEKLEFSEKSSLPDKPVVLPLFEKAGRKGIKIDTGKIDEKGKPIYSYKYADATNRHFGKEYAQGTNLEYFDGRKGVDPDLQNFIILTTGREEELPKEVVNAIKRGILTKQNLFDWFRKTDLSKMTQTTFDLLNECFFHNEYITNAEDLQKISQTYGVKLDEEKPFDIRTWYAVMTVFRKHGGSFESLLKTHDIDFLIQFVRELSNSAWGDEIRKVMTENFDKYVVDTVNFKPIIEEIATEEEFSKRMRPIIMSVFDGSAAGAFYMVKYFRNIVRNKYWQENTISLETDLNGVHKGSAAGGEGDGISLADTLTEENRLTGLSAKEASIYKDIILLYDYEYSEENMIANLSQASQELYEKKIVKLLKPLKEAKNSSEFDKREGELTKIIKIACKEVFGNNWSNQYQVLEDLLYDYIEDNKKSSYDKFVAGFIELMSQYYKSKLQQMTYQQVVDRYEALLKNMFLDMKNKNGEAIQIDFTDTITKETTNTSIRAKLQAQAKTLASSIIKEITSGKAVFKNLPKDVQEMFKVTKTKAGYQYELKKEYYLVGKGGQKTKDTTRLQTTVEVLKNVKEDIKNQAFASRETVKVAEQASKKLQKERKAWEHSLETKVDKNAAKQTEMKIPKKSTRKIKETTDTPNNFTIYSNIEMPDSLRKIFNTSFADMADTKVQFASKDEAGNVYTKDNKEFESRLQHEVSNWDTFYEHNRQALLSLTRNDVLDIIEFIQKGGIVTFDGPANKLAAFQLFTVGWIVDAARRNLLNWNMSDAEIEMIEALYETIASFYGSGLNAVKQMLSTVDPYKKIKQRYLENFDIAEDEIDTLFEQIEDLQKEKDQTVRQQKAQKLNKTLADLENKMYKTQLNPKTGEIVKRGFGKRWWSKLKSMRFTFMLSSPTTWIRNIVSNVVTTGFNISADSIAKVIFSKKSYKEGQLDLSIKASERTKDFVANEFKNSDFFDILYDNSTKYSDRERAIKKKTMFVDMVMRAVQSKYAAGHRFDSVAANKWAAFIDKMISDKRFIKFATNRYFTKMLEIATTQGIETTEVQENGKLATKKKVLNLEDGITDDVLNLFAEAVVMAQTEYMHKKSFLGDAINSLRDKSPIAYEVLSFWQPFINSSFSWFAEALNYTPFGLIKSIWQSTRLEQTIQKIEERRAKGDIVADSRVTQYLLRRNIGKGIIGSILLVTGLILGGIGVVRIDDDDDKLYMYVCNLKLDISNIFGTSSLLTGAAITSFWKTDRNWLDVLADITDTVLDDFILKDLFETGRYSNNFFEFLLSQTESMMKSFTPQMVQMLVRFTNMNKKQYSPGVMGGIERWINSFVPTQPMGTVKINPYTGEPETNYAIPVIGEIMRSGILGAKIWWIDPSDQELLAKEYGVNKSQIDPEITINGQKIKIGNKQKLNEYYGELNNKSLKNIEKESHLVRTQDGSFKKLSWDKLNDEQKKNVIEKTMTNNAKYAKIYTWTQAGHKYYADDSLYDTLRKLGITKNVYRGDKGYVE